MSSKQRDRGRKKLRPEQVDGLVRDVVTRRPLSEYLAQETYEALTKQMVSTNPAWSHSAPDSEAVASELKAIGQMVASGKSDMVEVQMETMARESASRVAEQVKKQRSIGDLTKELWDQLQEDEAVAPPLAGAALLYADAPQMERSRELLPDTVAASSRGNTMVGIYHDMAAAISAAKEIRAQARLRPGFACDICAIAETAGPVEVEEWTHFESWVQRAAFLGHENPGARIFISASAPGSLQGVPHVEEEGAQEIGGLGKHLVFSILDE